MCARRKWLPVQLGFITNPSVPPRFGRKEQDTQAPGTGTVRHGAYLIIADVRTTEFRSPPRLRNAVSPPSLHLNVIFLDAMHALSFNLTDKLNGLILIPLYA